MKLFRFFLVIVFLSVFSTIIHAQQSYLGLKEVAIEVANQRKILAQNAGYTIEAQTLESQITTMETTTFTAPIIPINAIGFNPIPTDIANNPHAAFALRKLKASYTGNAIRVRRSSDNTLQDIGFLPNGELNEAALLNFVGNGNGFVHTWYNQSASNNAINTTQSRQPQIVANGVIIKRNGKPCIMSTGTQFLSATAPNPSIPVANCYISIVYEHTGNNTGGVLDLANASGLRFGVRIRDRLEFLNGGTTNPNRLLLGSNPVIKNTGLYVYGFRASASENKIAIRFNQNISGTAGRPATSSVSNRIRLFIDSDSNYDSGCLSESIIFRDALTQNEIKILERNQMLFYNSGIQ
jgi:hypothetical protein